MITGYCQTDFGNALEPLNDVVKGAYLEERKQFSDGLNI